MVGLWGVGLAAAAWLCLAAGLPRGPTGLKPPLVGAGALLAQYPRAGEPSLRLSHMAIDHKTRRIYVAGKYFTICPYKFIQS